jgi:hypothetical protein
MAGGWHWYNPGSAHSIFHPEQRVSEMRKDRNKIKSAVTTRRKTDSAGWRDATVKSLTYAQLRIRHLCKAFLAGEVTATEFKQELPTILDSK